MDRVEILGGLIKNIDNVNFKNFSKNFDERLILQKTVYFLQIFGLNLGYFFNWYIHGPYSTDLAKDGYILEKKINTIPKMKITDENLKKSLEKFNFFLDKYKNNPAQLEILASINFLHKLAKKKPEIKNIIIIQKNFKENEFNSAWLYLEKNNLISE